MNENNLPDKNCPDCPDCKGTGLIETQSVKLGRPYYDKEYKGIVYETHAYGSMEKTQCWCIGE